MNESDNPKSLSMHEPRTQIEQRSEEELKAALPPGVIFDEQQNVVIIAGITLNAEQIELIIDLLENPRQA